MLKSRRHPSIVPSHPGEIIAMGLEETGITRSSLAQALGVSRNTLYKLLEGKQGVTADMALRLEAVWGSTAQTWLNVQQMHDLWHAEKRIDRRKLKRIAPEHEPA